MTVWTDPNLALLQSLVTDRRGLSAADIAAELVRQGVPVTRMAVIGKTRRIGLTLPRAVAVLSVEQRYERDREQRIKKAARRKAKAAGAPKQKRSRGYALPFRPSWDCGSPAARILRAAELRAEQTEEVPHIDDTTIPIGQRRTLMELTSATCRWPCGGEGANTWFCGGQALDGESYCHGHWLRAYTVEPRRAA